MFQAMLADNKLWSHYFWSYSWV